MEKLTIEDMAYDAMVNALHKEVKGIVKDRKSDIQIAVKSFLTDDNIYDIIKDYIYYDEGFREFLNQIMYEEASKVLTEYLKGKNNG